MRWASAISQAARLEDALDEALETLMEDLEGTPDLVVAFASPDYNTHLVRLGPHIQDRCAGASVVGCSAAGVIGGGHEIENERALSLTAAVLPGVEVATFHLDDDPDEWRERVGADEPRAFVLLADPFTCPITDLLGWLDVTFPRSPKIGGLASGGYGPGSTALFAGGAMVRSGAVGIALFGDIEVATVVAQGCRPVGSPVFITRAEGSTIYELDGQPALEVLETLYGQLPAHDQELFRHSLFLGVVMDRCKQEYRQGDFLIRNIVGIVPQAGALAVASEVVDRQVVQFHLRDASTSAADLETMLASHDGETPRGALMFSCLGRGVGLYGRPDHDSELFRSCFGHAALGGFFCNGEIGPVGGRTFVHGYTSSLGLFSPRRRS